MFDASSSIRKIMQNMSEISISVQNIKKSYSVKTPQTHAYKKSFLSNFFESKENAQITEHVALKNINFELLKGEAVGVVGSNGAGKSTLLQIISGIIQPTEGSVFLSGRITALLELGSTFNPDFTGRENVELACSVLGLSKNKIEAKLPEIEAFADIGVFFEMPMKTYSTGMSMRLAFAANTAVEPDVLIVDEVLSVGDAPFQAKCFRRLQKLLQSGTTLLLVSHDIGTVRSVCQRAIWLEAGQVNMIGESTKVCDEYQKHCLMKDQTLNSAEFLNTGEIEKFEHKNEVLPEEKCYQILEAKIGGYGTKHLEIIKIQPHNETNKTSANFSYGDLLNIGLTVRANKRILSDFVVGALIRDIKGRDVLAANNFDKIRHLKLDKGEMAKLRLQLPLQLTHQSYSVLLAVFGFEDGVALLDGNYDFSRANIWNVIEESFFFEVLPNKPMPLNGPVHIPIQLTMG